MNAKEIIDALDRGERVIIDAEDSGTFMQEVAAHRLGNFEIKMLFTNGRCTLTRPRRLLTAAHSEPEREMETQ